MADLNSFQKYAPGNTTSSSDNTTNAVKNESKPEAVNKYSILIDIQGLIVSNLSGDTVKYQEICDYMNSNMPARLVTFTVKGNDAHRLLNMQKEAVNGFDELYDIKMLAIPLVENGIQNKPFLDGEFKALIHQSESNIDYMSSVDPNSPMLQDNGVSPQMTVTMKLFRESELQYGVNNNTNFNYVNPTLTDVFLNSFFATSNNLFVILSRFDHNPRLNNILIRPMSFDNLIDMLESELGFYKTNYIKFVENNLLFFLNTDNNINVKYKPYEVDLHVAIARPTAVRIDRGVVRMDDHNFACSMESSDVKIYKRAATTFATTQSGILPSGNRAEYSKSLSRGTATKNKFLEIPEIEKLNSPQYEMIELSILDNSLAFLSPMSRIIYTDSLGRARIYRVCYRGVEVQAGLLSKTTVKGFRIITEEQMQI